MPSWWNYGKLRLSYGIVGNAPETYTANIVYEQGSDNGFTWNTIPLHGECRYPSGKEVRIRDRSGKQVFKQPVGYRYILLQQPCKGPDTLHAATFHIRRKECVDECGRVANHGWDISISATPILTRDFRWDLTANYGVYKNKVVKLADGVPYLEILNSGGSGIKIQAVEGQPMGDIYAQVPR